MVEILHVDMHNNSFEYIPKIIEFELVVINISLPLFVTNSRTWQKMYGDQRDKTRLITQTLRRLRVKEHSKYAQQLVLTNLRNTLFYLLFILWGLCSIEDFIEGSIYLRIFLLIEDFRRLKVSRNFMKAFKTY